MGGGEGPADYSFEGGDFAGGNFAGGDFGGDYNGDFGDDYAGDFGGNVLPQSNATISGDL